MLMILARLVRSEGFWVVAKVRSPHTGPGIRYIIESKAARKIIGDVKLVREGMLRQLGRVRMPRGTGQLQRRIETTSTRGGQAVRCWRAWSRRPPQLGGAVRFRDERVGGSGADRGSEDDPGRGGANNKIQCRATALA